MLVNAKLYIDELNKLFTSIEYDMKYQYYFSGRNRNFINNFSNEECMYFVSVDKNDKIHGYISFAIDKDSNIAYQFGMMAFVFNSKTFVNDVLELINNIFLVYNLDKIEWNCFEDNPAYKLYKHFCDLTNGKICGKYTNSNKLLDGNLHNSIMFELMKEDYLKSKLYAKLNGDKSNE